MEIGDKVRCIPYDMARPEIWEKGVIKGFADSGNPFVVYNCGEDWDNYSQYTGANTPLTRLIPGWE